MVQSNLKEYDCLLVYDDEESSFSHRGTREDNSLLFRYVNFVDRQLKSCDYRIHHHDRDSIPGRSVFYELERVIESSQVILLILDKGFLKNSWKCFSKEAAIKNLIDASTDPNCNTSNRLIPIFIRLEKNEIPFVLKTLTPIEIKEESDITEKWKNLKIAIDWHFRQEPFSRSINPLAPQQNYPQGTPEPQYASALSREPRVNPINNGPSSRSAILPNLNTVNTPESPSTETSINESTLLNHETLNWEHVTIPRDLPSIDVEVDAPYSLNPKEAETLQENTVFKDLSSTVRPTSRVSDSSIGLDSSRSLRDICSVYPTLLNDDLESAVNYTPNPDNSYCGIHPNKPDTSETEQGPEGFTTGNPFPSFKNDYSGTPQDRVDMAPTECPCQEGFTPEEREKPSFIFRAFHFSLHVILQPDKVYVPP